MADEPCGNCGKEHPKLSDLLMPLPGNLKKLAKMLQGGPVFVPFGPGSPFGPPPNPNTAFLRTPMQFKSRPLTSGELRTRFQDGGKRAHHKACRCLVEPDVFLDYVSCGQCNVALGKDDVFWKSIYGKKKRKNLKKRGKK